MPDASHSRERVDSRAVRQDRVRAIGDTAARISHELNNQLTVLIGHVDLALLGADAASRQALGLVRSAAQRIAKMVAALERLGAVGTPTPRAVDLIAEIRDVVSGFERRMDEVGSVRLVADTETLPVITDPGFVYEALIHVLANAVRATDDRGDIEVAVTTDASQWRISISDNGPGFDAQILGQAFDPLITTRRMPGAGLGLSRALLAMAALDGDVSIDASDAAGARVTLSAPLVKADGPVEARLPPVLVPGSGTVLIVDDAPVALLEAFAIVAGAGYDVVLARGFGRALDHLTNGLRPDLVLAEAVLYDGGATELAEWLAQRQQTPPVIATAFAAESPPADAQQYTAVATKPFDAHSLTALLAETLTQRRPR